MWENLIGDAGSWDLDSLNVGNWEVSQVEDGLVTGLLHETTGVLAVAWHASEAEFLGGSLLGFESTTALGDWLKREADAVGELLDEGLLNRF